MEKVDIIDGNLKILYTVTKNEAHEKGLLHATAVAEVVNTKGEWLLVKQAGHKQDPGQFVSPVGGHVASGESYDDALKREAEEEIGLKSKIRFELAGKKIYNRKFSQKTENHYFIVYKIYADHNPVLNDESVEFRWFSPEEIKRLLKENPKMFGNAFHFVAENFFAEVFT